MNYKLDFNLTFKKCINYFFFSKIILSKSVTPLGRKLQWDTVPPLSPLTFNRPPKVCAGFNEGENELR